MPFKPGQSGNPKGKPKGLIHSITNETREIMAGIVIGGYDKFVKELFKLNGAAFVDRYIRIAELQLPRKIQADFDVNTTNEFKVVIEVVEDANPISIQSINPE